MFNFKLDKNSLLIGIAIIGIIATGALILANEKYPGVLKFNFGSGLSNEAIAKKSVDYLNNSVLNGQATASLVSTSEESGLVKLKIKVNNKEFDSYATKDGRFLFPEAFKMETVATDNTQQPAAQNNQPSAEQQKQTCDTLAKADKPILQAFVVSKCPFGLQMQRILADVVKNAPSLAPNIQVVYMGSISNGTLTAMHGTAEAQENLRQICIRDEQAGKYWNYISCHIQKGDVDECLASAGVDKNKVTSCMSDNSRGLAYAKKDVDATEKYNVTGSPTLILGEANVSEFDFGGRTSEAIKTMICCASNSKPSVCSTQLNTSSAASSFSTTYSSGLTTGSNSANCAPAQ